MVVYIYVELYLEQMHNLVGTIKCMKVNVQDFGEREGDICLVSEVEEKIVGAVWVRIMDDYGHVEDGVPSFAISLYKEYRGLGIGTAMMKQMLTELKDRGYTKTSLAVQKEN